MRFGHFDDERREYVIHRPDTPLPWINYLGTDDFVGLISNTGGGYCFYRDARLRRLTRYRYDDVPVDGNGRFLYMRDEDSGEFWSPLWQPTRRPLETYECRHGLGYTTIRSMAHGIEVEATFFVPLGESAEVWSLRITNHRDAPVQLSAFGAVEFCLWNALEDATNYQRNLNIGEVVVQGSTIVHCTEFRERRNHVATFTSSRDGAGFETQRNAFLGPYQGWDDPQSVRDGRLHGSIETGGRPIGAHHVRFSLGPGEATHVGLALAYQEMGTTELDSLAESPELAAHRNHIQDLLNPEQIPRSLAELRAYWDDHLSVLQIETSDDAVDRMINTWNAYQCTITFNVSRSASRYESGIGRGIGFRDANQDLLGCVHLIPEKARQRLLDLASTQLVCGGAYHQYQPLTRKGNDAIGSGFNDDPLWLIYASAAYVKETGDASILDARMPYGDDPTVVESLYSHLLRAARYTTDRLGPHGLPLIGRADWNDCLNLNSHSVNPDESFQVAPVRDGKVAESIFIAALFCLACTDLAEMADRRGDAAGASYLRDAVADMRSAVDHHGWDGAWFLRAYDADGAKLGSSENDVGKIFVEPQGFCPMAGFGLADGRAVSALDSAERHLATDHGIMLVQPAFPRYESRLGEISSYPPGYKENGSVFCHANPWIVIAECMAGRADRAWNAAKKINPAIREEISEIHRCEPYVYAQTIVGRDAADHGRARNSWLTGTASWAYVAVTQWILGIRPTFDGLRIDPCVPEFLSDYRVHRTFRGTAYDIHVRTAPASGKNKKRILVDGKVWDGDILPLFDDSEAHKIEVLIGGES